MAIPDDLKLETGPIISGGITPLIVGGGMMLLAVVAGLTQTDQVVLEEWILPIGALSIFWLGWLLIAVIAGMYYKSTTRRDIHRMFENEIWQEWQFPAAEWQTYIDSVYRGMLPEKGDALAGSKASGCVGLVLAGIMLAVGKFAIKDDAVMPIIILCALGVFLLLLGIGLFQPTKMRYDAVKYRRQALRVPQPRFWFGRDGIYDEAFGFTSLKELVKVNDHTKSRKSIKLTVLVSVTHGSSLLSVSKYEVPVSFPVPAGHEQEASQLIRRYREERGVA